MAALIPLPVRRDFLRKNYIERHALARTLGVEYINLNTYYVPASLNYTRTYPNPRIYVSTPLAPLSKSMGVYVILTYQLHYKSSV